MVASVTMRAYTGAGATTESAAQTAIDLCDADALSGGPVLPGTVSFERWLRLRVDSAPVVGAANFWLMNTGDLPTGVSLLFGVTDTPKTPVNTPSTVATKTLTSGQIDTVGDKTRWIVVQEAVAAGAASGAIPEQALKWGWAER